MLQYVAETKEEAREMLARIKRVREMLRKVCGYWNPSKSQKHKRKK